MFSKILIANRGEIACRVERAARERGIAAVTLYTQKEALYPQRTGSRESAYLGNGSLRETYLNQELLIEIAKAHGCDAVHPGYGFLSENASFAERCEKEGLVFIGPSSEAIRLMGDKVRSKAIAAKAGVPVIPGYSGNDQSPNTLLAEAMRIGFPVLIKASAGGGGKGMRVVSTQGEFHAALESCQREAQGAFGSSLVLLEKYLQNARHIEIQVACDHLGNSIYIGERECSIQRRHQKIVEESPSIAADETLRKKMGQVSLALVKEIDYRNVGTIEFLVDEKKNFYFLEMNTRLQVEHPVSEECFGIDLVSLQLDIAQGKPLPMKQSDLKPRRHAIECRIYAEDPDNGFLPSIGKILRFIPPVGAGIRLDWGLAEGNEVGIDFDPLLGKLIATGDTRAQAIARMTRALEELVCLGVQTNIDFLHRLLATDVFRSGAIHTHLLEHLDLKRREGPLPEAVITLARVALANRGNASGRGRDRTSPWQRHSGWHMIGKDA